MGKQLDKAGLARLWAKVKAIVPSRLRVYSGGTERLPPTNLAGACYMGDVSLGLGGQDVYFMSTTGSVEISVCTMGGTSSAPGKVYLDFSLNIETATTTGDGLMGAADKEKLDGVAEGANKYTLPVASTTVLGGIKIPPSTQIFVGNNYPIRLTSGTNYAYCELGTASSSRNGLMSTWDKAKLDEMYAWYEKQK